MDTNNQLKPNEASTATTNRPAAAPQISQRGQPILLLVIIVLCLGIAWFYETNKKNIGLLDSSKTTNAHDIAFSVTGPCAKGVRFEPWKEDWGCWTSDMTLLGGLIDRIEYTAFDVGGVKIDSGNLIISADIKQGETTVTKVCVAFQTERVVRVEILVSGYCN